MMLIEHKSLTTKQIVVLYIFIHDEILEFTYLPNRNRVAQEAQAQ